jgi:hypothetical protein
MKLFTVKSIFVFLLVMCLEGCEDFVAVDPPTTQISSETVFGDNLTAEAALRGLYSDMYLSSAFGGGLNSLSTVASLSGDELRNYSVSPQRAAIADNSLTSTHGDIRVMWQSCYRSIFYANTLLDGLIGNDALNDVMKARIEGEAKFVRSLCYFYLVNLFGDVPKVISKDYRENMNAPRAPSNEIYDLIAHDLETASALLLADFSVGRNERVRPTKWAAVALLSRVWLYRGDYAKADALATSIIDQKPLFSLVTDLNGVFLRNSTEAIWQLMPRATSNTAEANLFILTAAPVNVALNNSFASGFETNDLRRSRWVSSVVAGGNTYFFPFKYKSRVTGTVTEYSMVLRLAEQYLIRAESRAQSDNLSGAIDDVDVLRQRAMLPLIRTTNPTISKADLLHVIERERRAEFFCEYGHRWLDLKRSGRVDAVLGPIKLANWQPTDALYPIPQSDIFNNANLTQNPGY